jgi:phosphate starvation-inducible PhoH-like protein
MPRSQRQKKNLRPLNEEQEKAISAIENFNISCLTGNAGTGKTFIMASLAIEALLEDRIQKIVLTRPNAWAARSIGLLPGDMHEKMAPWIAPYLDVFKLYVNEKQVETWFKYGTIEVVPFEYVQGRTFHNAYIILDEAQNTLVPEMIHLLTRHGRKSKLILNGDIRQKVIKRDCGLAWVIEMADKYDLPVACAELEKSVRSESCQMWQDVLDKERIYDIGDL